MARSTPLYRYTLRDLQPDDDPETWARTIAEEGGTCVDPREQRR